MGRVTLTADELELLTDEQWDALVEAIGPLRLPEAYCPWDPHAKQEWFLRHDDLEVFFGGAAGPGKSIGLLMGALQYVDFPGYDALILRRTLTEFELPGGLIDISHEWLDGSDAWWNGTKREWAFPSGATLRFGYLKTDADIRRYKGAALSFLGFDELTGFTESLYRSMFRVLRQPLVGLEGVPVRCRSASNPGDIGHEWVKTRFVDPKSRHPGVVFVPATIHDNPHLDYAQYLHTLRELDPIERARLIAGDWDVTVEGGKFVRGAFTVIDEDEVAPARKTVRYWDLAGTEIGPANPDPDWTVGLRMDVDAHGLFTVRHIVRGRWADHDVEKRVRETAEADGRAIPVYVEQDPGQAGKNQLGHYKRNVLQGYPCHAGLTRNLNKEVRARPVAAAVNNFLVRVVRGPHTMALLDEASIFPLGTHDDIVDALSGAHHALTSSAPPPKRQTSKPTARIPGVHPLGSGGIGGRR